MQAQVKFEPRDEAPIVNPNVYGHFAEHLGRCIYEGIWVGEDSPIPNVRGIRKDVVAALKALNLPVLRWPGGCFADEYHWKDGIGPRDRRPAIFNTHWGGVVENNHFGTHEFFDLCEQLGCDAYVCGNVGSGEVREMQEWVEYITSAARSPMADLRRQNGREAPWKLPYFGVGNESWGCGGNMRPEYYADLYRRYATFVRDYTGNRVQRIACGARRGPRADGERNDRPQHVRRTGSRESGAPEDRPAKRRLDRGGPAREVGRRSQARLIADKPEVRPKDQKVRHVDGAVAVQIGFRVPIRRAGRAAEGGP